MDAEEIRKVVSGCPEVLAKTDDKCMICLGEFVFGGDEDEACRSLPKCQHVFHTSCLLQMLSATGKCGVCNLPYVKIVGNQPVGGTMTHSVSAQALPGYPGCGTITIAYAIPSGIQSQAHPHPGSRYSGTSRVAFLPDNLEGRELLRLLQVCFERRLTFTVGTSLTTGQQNAAVWNGVHHKTSQHGGPSSFGYPDDTYLARLREELSAKGIVSTR